MPMDVDTLYAELRDRIRETGVNETGRLLGTNAMRPSRALKPGGLESWPMPELLRLMDLFGYRVSIHPPRRRRK
jgi:hypothetical protein